MTNTPDSDPYDADLIKMMVKHSLETEIYFKNEETVCIFVDKNKLDDLKFISVILYSDNEEIKQLFSEMKAIIKLVDDEDIDRSAVTIEYHTKFIKSLINYATKYLSK